ncbi:hypothetical protein SmJEL517_g02718 [Synchytrium microbalum]|uniref:Uncharacterized protein n=1 Tax=Synchytrium microbalum TaxID=1806994 RepID=A0A507CB25_9FUNG|nr:uncharacterized protein SmJEL517_g02718 [Synchytrium microbalum]TPX34733.1 hypothetical protein SmJEL517_g02718 [Synchytrium microbalum]
MPADRPKRTRVRVSVMSPDPTPTPSPSPESPSAPTSPYDVDSVPEPPRPPVSYTQPHNPEMCALELVEHEIDWSILHPTEKAAKERKGAAAFKRSVTGLQKIVNEKLYRVVATSVQAYFKNRFDLTRAQAYRFIDCAVVLEILTGLKHPTRERLCRCLKKTCPNKADMRAVWISALAERQNDPDRVNSSLIESLAEEHHKDAAGGGSSSPVAYIESGNPVSTRVNGALRKVTSTGSILTPDSTMEGEHSEEPQSDNDIVQQPQQHEPQLQHHQQFDNSHLMVGMDQPAVYTSPEPVVKHEGLGDQQHYLAPLAASDDDNSSSSSEEEIDTDDSDVYVPKPTVSRSGGIRQPSARGTRGRPRTRPRSPASSVEPPKRRGVSVGSNGSGGTPQPVRKPRAATLKKLQQQAAAAVKREAAAAAKPPPMSNPQQLAELVASQGQVAANILQQFSQLGFDLQPRVGQTWRGGITEWRVSTIANPPAGCIAIDDQGDVMAWEGASEAELERVMNEVVHSNDMESEQLSMAPASPLDMMYNPYNIMMHHPSATANRMMHHPSATANRMMPPPHPPHVMMGNNLSIAGNQMMNLPLGADSQYISNSSSHLQQPLHMMPTPPPTNADTTPYASRVPSPSQGSGQGPYDWAAPEAVNAAMIRINSNGASAAYARLTTKQQLPVPLNRPLENSAPSIGGYQQQQTPHQEPSHGGEEPLFSDPYLQPFGSLGRLDGGSGGEQ